MRITPTKCSVSLKKTFVVLITNENPRQKTNCKTITAGSQAYPTLIGTLNNISTINKTPRESTKFIRFATAIARGSIILGK
jgi:hypothetical protein